MTTGFNEAHIFDKPQNKNKKACNRDSTNKWEREQLKGLYEPWGFSRVRNITSTSPKDVCGSFLGFGF